ncbi:hypothetical protein MPSEU_000896400 [Mayamaea pseudoterrestris]|nr:hypothetical protein MPSEU_000896400 [Mayamaea pseudoterrestris]
MDDLLALLEDDSALDTKENGEEAIDDFKACPHSNNDNRNLNPRPKSPPAASVDIKVGIRMLNRKISGAELLDLTASYPYYSAPSIAAMSTAALNRLLVDPASTFLDRTSTVCGTSNFVTVSIVLSNTGTRISGTSGNAYCMLTLGTLTSGPAISVMLFGSAYSECIRICSPGKVIALVCPRLMPARSQQQASNVSSPVLFSVQNTEQCQVVADARDFGRCHAKVADYGHKRTTHSGDQKDHSLNLPKQCKNIVDTRQGNYCPLHRKLALQKRGNAPTNMIANTLAMGKLVAESKTFPLTNERIRTIQTASGRIMTLPDHQRLKHNFNNHQRPQSNIDPFKSLAPQQQARQLNLVGNTCGEATGEKPSNKTQRSNNSILCPSHGGTAKATLRQAPKLKLSTDQLLHRPSPLLLDNPYTASMRRPPLAMPKSTPASLERNITMNTPVTTDWLNSKDRRVTLGSDKSNLAESTKRKSNHNSTKRINLGNIRRDGAVLVPNPSQVFTKIRLLGQVAVPAARKAQPKERAADAILLQQQVMAEQIQRSQGRNIPDRLPTMKATSIVSNREALLFGDINIDHDLTQIAATRSKYESEAMAEEYTRSRNRLNALDQLEEKAQQIKSKTKEGPIEKSWHCATCQQTFIRPPLLCQRRGHAVKVRRSLLEETKTRDEQRLAMSEAKNGLVLGQGLEWSRWNK